MKHLRAVLVLLHCLAIFLLSFPAPVGAMKKSAWRTKDMQATFASYTEAINGLGVELGQDELEAILWDAGTRFMAVRNQAVAPFQPYLRLTGSKQGWRMFGTVNRRPAWLEIEVGESKDGPWRTVYRMRSTEHDWRRSQFDQERTRALVNNWSWLGGKKSYEQFSVWIAQRASEDFPDESHMRIGMERIVLPPPEELHAEGMPAGTRRWETVYSLDKYR